MDTRGTTMRQVAMMQFAPDEIEAMASLNTVWVQTMDLKHDNVLAYPVDIMVENVSELYPRKYIDKEEYFPYTCENGGTWLISQNIQAGDLDAFFQQYLHLDEVEAAAA